MTAWWLTVLLFLASAGVNYILRPKPKIDAPAPTGRDEVDMPVVEEGRAVTLVWGTCKLTSPMILNYGDLQHWEIDPIGHPGVEGYFLGIMFAWCLGPLDAIVSFQWDDKETEARERGGEWPWPPWTMDGPVIPYPIERTAHPDGLWLAFNDHGLFGGLDEEGGIYGYANLWWGDFDQSLNYHLPGMYGSGPSYWLNAPMFRNLVVSHFLGIIGQSFYQGTSPYLKPHSMVVRRCPNSLGLTGGEENIDGDANPACIIYEALVNTDWGCGIPPALLHTESFRAAALTLAAEGFGLSLQQNGHSDADEVINEVLRHIDGVIYPERTSGLPALALIRPDYDPDTLLELDDSHILDLEEFDRPGPEALANKVLISYTDRDQEYQTKVAPALDLAGVQSLGGLRVQDLSFPGITRAALAQSVAARELKAVAYPFATIRFTTNRHAWSLRPGSPFKFTCSPLGVEGMVCRVVRIALGGITEGTIRIEAVEDAFGADWTAYSPPSPSQWVFPLEPPVE